MKRTLFLSWQDSRSRRWYPIGRLTSSSDGKYRFAYIGGAEEARAEGSFRPLPSFPDLHTTYESNELFPLFSNRVLPRSRPEYSEVLEWLNVPLSEDDPVAILARSGGQRGTDSFEVFPCPERDAEGNYQFYFLIHGLSHASPEAVTRAERLTPGERLLVMKDVQNPIDSDALALRTCEAYPGDMYLVGYCPRYLRGDIARALASQDSWARITVERVNPKPVPVQYRVLCRAVMTWPAAFTPFAGDEYRPLVAQHADEFSLEALEG